MPRRPLDDLARDHTEDAVRIAAEIMNDPFAENRDRLKALQELLDRGYGKPLTAIIQVPAQKRLQQLAVSKTDAELLEIIERKQLPTLEAEYTPIDPLLE